VEKVEELLLEEEEAGGNQLNCKLNFSELFLNLLEKTKQNKGKG
jgi:hypothetical protein